MENVFVFFFFFLGGGGGGKDWENLVYSVIHGIPDLPKKEGTTYIDITYKPNLGHGKKERKKERKAVIDSHSLTNLAS